MFLMLCKLPITLVDLQVFWLYWVTFNFMKNWGSLILLKEQRQLKNTEQVRKIFMGQFEPWELMQKWNNKWQSLIWNIMYKIIILQLFYSKLGLIKELTTKTTGAMVIMLLWLVTTRIIYISKTLGFWAVLDTFLKMSFWTGGMILSLESEKFTTSGL